MFFRAQSTFLWRWSRSSSLPVGTGQDIRVDSRRKAVVVIYCKAESDSYVS